MRDFARLYGELDSSTSTAAKVRALREHLGTIEPEDAAWTVYLLAGGRPARAVSNPVLRAAACEAAGIEDWLFQECYQAVGDLAETVALVLPHGAFEPAEGEDGLQARHGLAQWMDRAILPLRGQPVDAQRMQLRRLWSRLLPTERFLLTKLLGGGFRVGMSRLLVQRAVAEYAGLQAGEVAQRMVGATSSAARPTAQSWHRLVGTARGDPKLDQARAYPFFLAHPLGWDGRESLHETLGPLRDWLVEWKFDGIRAQVVRRGQGVWIWTRGEELVTDRFPEVAQAAMALPEGTVIDGELLVMRNGQAAALAELQARITRKTLTKAMLQRSPVSLLAYDLLESQGQDRRSLGQAVRRDLLERLLQSGPFDLSPLVTARDWPTILELHGQSRSRGVEGLMLKHRDSPYGMGRRKPQALTSGGWWKWKVEPLSVDAVLIYAQAGHGRRASLYTDYTFAVWSRSPRDESEVQQLLRAIERREPVDPEGLHLVPFAKAYSGLTDTEFAQVDRLIRSTTIEKFGPVRSVVPSLVFELGFEGLAASARHKSGVAVRFPRMLRWRRDKPLHEADTLQSLLALGAVQAALAPAGKRPDSDQAD